MLDSSDSGISNPHSSGSGVFNFLFEYLAIIHEIEDTVSTMNIWYIQYLPNTLFNFGYLTLDRYQDKIPYNLLLFSETESDDLLTQLILCSIQSFKFSIILNLRLHGFQNLSPTL